MFVFKFEAKIDFNANDEHRMYTDKILQMRIIVNVCLKFPLKCYPEIVSISHSIFVLSVYGACWKLCRNKNR